MSVCLSHRNGPGCRNEVCIGWGPNSPRQEGATFTDWLWLLVSNTTHLLLLFWLDSIPNLEPGSRGSVVGMRARSLMPYCHFELEDSDYIRSGRRNPDLPGPPGASALDPNTRCIEFVSTGIGVCCAVKFDVINPTNQNYSFAWRCQDEVDAKQLPAFVCRSGSGLISSGRKTQVSKCSSVYN